MNEQVYEIIIYSNNNNNKKKNYDSKINKMKNCTYLIIYIHASVREREEETTNKSKVTETN